MLHLSHLVHCGILNFREFLVACPWYTQRPIVVKRLILLALLVLDLNQRLLLRIFLTAWRWISWRNQRVSVSIVKFTWTLHLGHKSGHLVRFRWWHLLVVFSSFLRCRHLSWGFTVVAISKFCSELTDSFPTVVWARPLFKFVDIVNWSLGMVRASPHDMRSRVIGQVWFTAIIRVNWAGTALHHNPSSVFCRCLRYSVLDDNFEGRFRPSAGLWFDYRLDWLFNTLGHVLLSLNNWLYRFLYFWQGWLSWGSKAIDCAHHVIELALKVKLLVTQIQLLFDVICFNLKWWVMLYYFVLGELSLCILFKLFRCLLTCWSWSLLSWCLLH